MKKCTYSFLLILAACGGGGGNDPSAIDCQTAKISGEPLDPTNWGGSIIDAEVNTAYISNEVTISGLGSGCTWIIFGSGPNRSYSINGGPFINVEVVIQDGDRVRLRHVSAPTYGTPSFWFMLRSTFSVTTRPGRPADAPLVTLLSPMDQATVHASRIIVSGIATDPDGVLKINVNGIDAISTDGFATWQAEVSLVSGINVLTVSSTDVLLNINPIAAEISIDNQATVLVNPKAIESDISNLRLLAVDQTLRALLAIDLVNGQHTVLSDENTPDATNLFTDPGKLVINNSGSTAWVIDRAYDDIIQVDLATGARTLLIDTVGTGTPQPLSGATDLVLDEVNGRLLLVMGEDATAQVLSLDLASGARTVLSDADTPDASNPFGTPKSLALDMINNRLLVLQRNFAKPVDSGNAILAIDPTTGQRTVLIDDTTLTNDPLDADIDVDNGRVLIMSSFVSLSVFRILTFDLALNELTTLFARPDPIAFLNPIQITRDPLNNRLLVLYDGRNIVGAIDFATGKVSIAY